MNSYINEIIVRQRIEEQVREAEQQRLARAAREGRAGRPWPATRWIALRSIATVRRVVGLATAD